MSLLCRRSLFVLIALLYFTSYATAAVQTVLTFDDVDTGAIGIVPMPPGYGGVSWATNMGIYGRSQAPYNPESPPNRVFFGLNAEGGVAESVVTFTGGPKVFVGAYFSGYNDVQFNLYNGATLVGTSSILSLGGSGPTFLASGYSGPVDTVGIVGERGFIVMDNFTFEAVPEPSSLLLCLAGIFATQLRRKRTC